MLNRRRVRLIIPFLFLFGFLFRLKLASLFLHAPVADEKTYLEMAATIKDKFWVAECCTRGFVYPMFLSIVFKFFGENNINAVFAVQSLLEVLTAVLLFFISKRVFRSLPWAVLSFVLYIINPLTAAFSGLVITEILAFFLVASTLLLLLKIDNIPLRFLAGVTLGLFMFNRLMYVYWGLILIAVLTAYHLLTRSSLLKNILPLVLGLILVTIYPSTANWKTFKTISPMPILPAGRYDYLISYKVDRWPILLDEYFRDLEPLLVAEYQIDFNNREEFIKETDRRIKIEHEKTLKNPIAFLAKRISHIPNFWDKRSLCCYKDPFYPGDSPFIRIGNIVFLAISFIGVFTLLRRKGKNRQQVYALIFCLSLVLYLTIALTLRVPEERHTMPAYPILLLFLPLGLNKLIKLKKLVKKA